MLLSFSISQQGAGHVTTGRECQDYSRTRVVTAADGRAYVIAAIADGVGSREFSRLGARVAVTSVLDCLSHNMCADTFDPSDASMTRLLRHGFAWALKAVADACQARGIELSLADSTLTAAVYDGSSLWFGHRGDDGIVVMHDDGTYAMVTDRHKREEANSVIPLRSPSGWQFGTVEEVASFVMMTDGMLDYCVDRPVMGNRVYLPFLYPLLYQPIDSEEEMGLYRGEWVKYLWGTDGRQPGGDTSKKHVRDACQDASEERDPETVDADGEETAKESEGETSEVEGDTTEEDGGAPRIRDTVFDDLTVVMVQNPERVRKLPPFSFDFERWESDTKERAQTRDAALDQAAAKRMEEQRVEALRRRLVELPSVEDEDPTETDTQDAAGDADETVGSSETPKTDTAVTRQGDQESAGPQGSDGHPVGPQAATDTRKKLRSLRVLVALCSVLGGAARFADVVEKWANDRRRSK